ncbi:MAG: MFS transporter, partial [Bacillota bacterium]
SLGVTYAGIAVYISFMTGTMALFQPFARKILALYDVRLVFSIAILISAGGFALMGTYHSLWGFYLSGIMLGLGDSFITFQLIPTMITRWFKTRVGFAMGFCAAMSAVGGTIMAPICGQLIANYGWRTAYPVFALIGFVIAIPFALFVMKNDPKDKGLEPYGAEEYAQKESSNGMSSINERGFTFSESAHSPYLYLCLLFGFAVSFALNFLVQITSLAYSLGFPIEKGALAASAMTVGGIIGSFLFGFSNDKLGTKTAVAGGLLCGVAGLILILLGGGTTAYVFIGVGLFGIATSLFSIAPPLVVNHMVGEKDYTKIYGFVASAITLASTFAGPTYGALYDITGSYNAGLILCISLLIIAIVVGLSGVTSAQQRLKRMAN